MEIFVYHTPDQVPDFSKKPARAGFKLEMPACAIVIDVLRATTTMATALQSGAEAIQVFDDLDELFRISKRWPVEQRLLAGERSGEKLDDFDLGNSPVGMHPGPSRRQTALHEHNQWHACPGAGAAGSHAHDGFADQSRGGGALSVATPTAYRLDRGRRLARQVSRWKTPFAPEPSATC
jgi:hypothetical protein